MAVAIGVHVFGGGFTEGVLREFDVPSQLEIHNLGRGSVEARGVDFIREKTCEAWPKINSQFVFGNPRCSGFSSMTAMSASRGPWCKQTQDIHDLCKYGITVDADVVVWESVRGAYGVGRDLLTYLIKEMFVPAGYRIAHVFEQGLDFGTPQLRKRYFFVAYRGGMFNVMPPNFKRVTVRDVIGHLVDRKTNEARLEVQNSPYDEDSYTTINRELKKCIPYIRQGEGLNCMARRDDGEMLETISSSLYEKWLFRSSEIPLGISTIPRLSWDRCPVIHGGSSHLIHPTLDRPITVGEASTLMGWASIPSGDYPIRQLAKGIIPNAGWWLSRHVKMCMNNDWENEDFGIHKNGKRYDTTKQNEKTIYAEVL